MTDTAPTARDPDSIESSESALQRADAIGQDAARRPEAAQLYAAHADAIDPSTDDGARRVAFVLAHPSRPVAIIGSQKSERLVEATQALGVTLDRNDVYDIIEASEGVPLP